VPAKPATKPWYGIWADSSLTMTVIDKSRDAISGSEDTTPLLGSTIDEIDTYVCPTDHSATTLAPEKIVPTPLPTLQLLILVLVRLGEPIAFMQIFPVRGIFVPIFRY
jgi:hypothetical protein